MEYISIKNINMSCSHFSVFSRVRGDLFKEVSGVVLFHLKQKEIYALMITRNFKKKKVQVIAVLTTIQSI